MIVLLGFFDDVFGLDALTKLAGQVVAAGVMVLIGLQFSTVTLPGIGAIALGQERVPLTILVALLTVNAINFVDGLDGLAAGVGAIAALAFFTFSYTLSSGSLTAGVVQSRIDSPTLIAVVLAGACLGFLPHNFTPARIFMGDSGSMLIGLMLAASVISLTGQQNFSNLPVSSTLTGAFPAAATAGGARRPLRRPAARRGPTHPGRPLAVRPRQGAPAPPAAGDRPQPDPGGADPLLLDRPAGLRGGRGQRHRGTDARCSAIMAALAVLALVVGAAAPPASRSGAGCEPGLTACRRRPTPVSRRQTRAATRVRAGGRGGLLGARGRARGLTGPACLWSGLLGDRRSRWPSSTVGSRRSRSPACGARRPLPGC